MKKYTLFQTILLACRKVYRNHFKRKKELTNSEHDPQVASNKIFDLLNSAKPCMIARFGSTEYYNLINYLSIKKGPQSIIGFIKDEIPDWWWNKSLNQQLQEWSGFFPPTEEKISQFCELMLEDMKQVDILGSWMPEEDYVKDRIPNVQKVLLPLLEPFHASNPWSRYLEGKKVLVVHPFAELIEHQYEQREKLFENPDILPQFELQTIKAVQSLGGDDNGFTDWFEALQWMKDEIDSKEYDVCLVGAGAYGFPLAAHVKRQGKQAIHLAGALQLLFGIKGKRWEDSSFGVKEWGLNVGAYSSMINQNWLSPGDNFKAKNASNVENGCYW